jgi:hypothetical protein
LPSDVGVANTIPAQLGSAQVNKEAVSLCSHRRYHQYANYLHPLLPLHDGLVRSLLISIQNVDA